MAEPPSSQPTSPAPNASSVRGKRAEAFEKLLNGALEHTLSKVSYDNFAACFPAWSQYKSRSLKDFHGQFLERLRATCQANFDDIVEQRKVVSMLNSLDSMIEQAIARKEAAEASTSEGAPLSIPTPPHRLQPEVLLAASLQPFLAHEQTSLHNRLTEIEARNVALADSLASQNREAKALMQTLERAIGDLERAGKLVQGDGGQDVNGLARETRAIEETLRQGA